VERSRWSPLLCLETSSFHLSTAQAANASDYSIGRFKFLQKLLLVHGRWNYVRMSMVRMATLHYPRHGWLNALSSVASPPVAPQLVLYSFYKNIMFSFAQWMFNFQSGWRCVCCLRIRERTHLLFDLCFGDVTQRISSPVYYCSGQKFYIEYANQTFNLLYTGVPILITAIFDQDVSAANALRFPHLYADGLQRLRLNNRLVFWWILCSLYEAGLMFLVSLYGTSSSASAGASPSIFEFGTYIFTSEVVVLSVRLAMNTYHHNLPFIIGIAASSIIWLPAAYIFDVLNDTYSNGLQNFLWGSLNYWLVQLLLLIMTLLPVQALHQVRYWWFPEYRDLVWDFQVSSPLALSSGVCELHRKTLPLLFHRACTRQLARSRRNCNAAFCAAQRACLAEIACCLESFLAKCVMLRVLGRLFPAADAVILPRSCMAPSPPHAAD
jgi:phospholipid-transporting ATPase